MSNFRPITNAEDWFRNTEKEIARLRRRRGRGQVSTSVEKPPALAGLVATGGIGSVTLSWDGTVEEGRDVPSNFHYVQVFASNSIAVNPADENLVGVITTPGGGMVTVDLGEGTWWLAARILTTSLQQGPLSAPMEVEQTVPTGGGLDVAPKTPTGVTVDTDVEWMGSLGWRATAVIEWDAVTQRTDGSPVTPTYRVLMEREDLPGRWQDMGTTGSTTLTVTGLEIAVEHCIVVIAEHPTSYPSGRSTPECFTQGGEAGAPGKPNPPIMTTVTALVVGRWDGALAPIDLDRVEFHRSTTAGFTPGPGTLVAETKTTSPVALPKQPEGTPYYYKVVVYDVEGLSSPPSDASDPVTVKTFVSDEDLADLEQQLNDASDWIAVTGADLASRLAQAETDLADAESALTTLRDVTLPALQGRLEDAEAAIEDIDVEGLQDRLDDAEAAVTTLQTVTLPALTSRLEDAEEAVDEFVNETLPALQSSLSDAEDAITTLVTTTIPALDGRLDDAESSLSTLETTTLPALSSRLTDAEGDITTLRDTDLPALEGRLTDAEGEITTLTDVTLPALDSRLGDAEDAVNTLEGTTLPALSNRLDDAEDAVEEAQTTLGTAFPGGAFNVSSSISSAASAAEAAAIAAAATDAANKAEAARVAAEAAAALHAEAEAEAARLAAIAAASGDATAKAAAAEAAAIAAAALDATAKANAAQEAAELVASQAQQAAEDAQQAAEDAQNTADGALLAANGKNKNTFTDVATANKPGPTPSTAFGAGRTVGDVHRNRDTDTGEVYAEWRWTGSAWQPINYGDSILRSLDVGKLSAGSATIDTGVLNFLTAQIATIIELHADRITSGTIDAARLNAGEIAAAVATIISLDASRITSGTISTARLDANSIAAAVASVIELNANRITSGTINADRLDTVSLAASIATIISLSADRITSGTISTARLDAEAVAAAVGEFLEINAGQITAGTIDTDRLNASQIAAAVATVISLDASRITSGTIDTDRLNANEIAAAVATVISLNANRITSGTISTDRLNANEIAAAVATVISLSADRITSGTIDTDRLNAGEIAAAVASVIELNASRITSGTISTARLDAEAVAAAVGEFLEITTDQLVAGTGTMGTAVVSKLWTDVVRSRKITTDMLLVGSGENLIPDPQFTDTALNAYRNMQSTGTWTYLLSTSDQQRSTTTTTTGVVKFVMAASELDQFFPVEAGKTYRIRVDAYGSRNVRAQVLTRSGAGTAGPTFIGSYGTHAGNAWKTHEWEWTAPSSPVAAAFAKVEFEFASGTAQVYLKNPSLIGKADASLIVDGSILARHVDAESVAAEVGEFIEVSASQITAGTINAAVSIGTSGFLQVGDPLFPHVYVGDGMIESRIPGQSGPIPQVTMGGPDTAFRVLDANGAHIGGIEPDGRVVAPEADIGVLRIEGEDLINDIIYPRSEGVTVWSGQYQTTRGPYTERTGVYEVDFDAVGGRRYRIDVVSDWRSTGGSTVMVTGLTKTESTSGTAPAPLVTSTQFAPGIRYIETAGGYRAQAMTWWFSPSVNEHARFLWFIQPFAGAQVDVRNYSMVVTDYGVKPENTGRHSLGGAPGTPPADPTPPLKDYVKTFNLTPHQVWTQFGAGDTYAPSWVRSGNHSSFTSIYRTFLMLPSGALSALSSASSVSKVEVRLTQNSGWPGQPWLGTHTATNITSSHPSILDGFQSSVSQQTGQTKWHTLSTAARNRLATGGGRGIVVGRTTAVTNQDFYGPSASSSVRPQIRISYKA